MFVYLILGPVLNKAYPGLGVIVHVLVMSLLVYLVPVVLYVLHAVPQALLRLLEVHKLSNIRAIKLWKKSPWHMLEVFGPGPHIRDLLEIPHLNGFITVAVPFDKFLGNQRCRP